jgi:hypothetical protein
MARSRGAAGALEVAQAGNELTALGIKQSLALPSSATDRPTQQGNEYRHEPERSSHAAHGWLRKWGCRPIPRAQCRRRVFNTKGHRHSSHSPHLEVSAGREPERYVPQAGAGDRPPAKRATRPRTTATPTALSTH